MRKNNELEISITDVELDQVEEGDLHDITQVGFDVVEEKTMRVDVREGSGKSDPGLFERNMFKSMRESGGFHPQLGRGVRCMSGEMEYITRDRAADRRTQPRCRRGVVRKVESMFQNATGCEHMSRKSR